jgi:PPOX class probable F420-dependent enzyme
MPAMTPEETWDFLMAGTRTAKVATVRTDGRPHVKPVWFELAGQPAAFQLLFTTHSGTVTGRNLSHDPRVMLAVDDPEPLYSFVLIEGTAELSTNLDEIIVVATRLGGRYMGDDRAAEYGARNGVPTERLVRVTPTRVLAERGYRRLARQGDWAGGG